MQSDKLKCLPKFQQIIFYFDVPFCKRTGEEYLYTSTSIYKQAELTKERSKK